MNNLGTDHIASSTVFEHAVSLNDERRNYFNWDNSIDTVNAVGLRGRITLHVASSSHRHSEAIQLLFTSDALQSFKYAAFPVGSRGDMKIEEIKHVYRKASSLFDFQESVQDLDNIEWSLTGENMLFRRREFREQIDLYKTYDNRHHLITKLLVEIIEYYLNEYLVKEENFSKDEAKKLESYFKKAIEEKSYLTYFIKAYTLTNNFHRVLNKHLALYILDYFDTPSYSSLPTRYRLINCLVHIVTLLVNHPDIGEYTYKGVTFRGVPMAERDLKPYTIGNHILNRSFLSTSKSRSVAQMFAESRQQSSSQVLVILKYTIKQNKTAIDIEHLSTVRDEKEVLILPFSVFQVNDIFPLVSQQSSSEMLEIHLEECEDNEQIGHENILNQPIQVNRHWLQMKIRLLKPYIFCVILLVLIICSLVSTIAIILKDKKQSSDARKIRSNETIKATCPPIINRPMWNASKPNGSTALLTPVSHVAILHTVTKPCNTLSDCILELQKFQRFHMQHKNWSDIGYNFLVGSNGLIFEGRGWNHSGAHCKGYNNISIGIGAIGDFTSVLPPMSLIEAIRTLIGCGISYGFIQNNFTFVGHWGYGVLESYLHKLNQSDHSREYCVPQTTTHASQIVKNTYVL